MNKFIQENEELNSSKNCNDSLCSPLNSSSHTSEIVGFKITKDFLNSRTRIKKLKERIIYIFDYRKDIRNSECNEEVINKHVLKELKEKKQWDLLKHPYMLNFINENIIYTPEVYFLHIITCIFFFILLYSFILVDQYSFKMLLLKCSILFFFEFMIFKFFLSFHKQKDLTDRFALFHYSSILIHTIIILLIWNIIIYSFTNYIDGTKMILKCYFSLILILSVVINSLYLTSKWFNGIYIKIHKKIVMPFFGKSLLFIPTILIGIVMIITKIIVNFDNLDSNTFLYKILWSLCTYSMLLEIFLIFQSMNLFFAFDLRNYSKLRNNFDFLLLNEKVNHSMECLEMIEACKILNPIGWSFTTSRSNNVLIINTKKISSYSIFESSVDLNLIKKNYKKERKNFGCQVDKENDGKDISESIMTQHSKLFSSSNNLLFKNLSLTSDILEYKGEITNEMIDYEEHWLKKFKCWLFGTKEQKSLTYKKLVESKI